MSVPTCTYLKPDGAVCNSSALREKRFCYFRLDPETRRLKADGLAPSAPCASLKPANAPRLAALKAD